MFDEEESKKLRIFQRYERQELQLIIERCNEVDFDYVCVPSIRSDKDLCFGNKTPRKIHLFADDKTVNSYIRKCYKEHFAEPVKPVEVKETEGEDEKEELVEVKPSHPFSSRVPRFQDIVIDSSGVYRRKRKTRQPLEVTKKVHSAFGSSSPRSLLLTRNPVNSLTPGVGTYNVCKTTKNFFHHSFGGDIKIEPAYSVICYPFNLEAPCSSCEEMPKNIYWKNKKTQAVLCRPCYNKAIQKKYRGVVEQTRKLHELENDFEKKRYCDFYHEHNKSFAAVKKFSPKECHKRMSRESFLNTLFKY